MRSGPIVLCGVAVAIALAGEAPSAIDQELAPRVSAVAVGRGTLYARAIGQGRPIVVLHGGPDFDHRYLLPDLDRFGDTYRLIYYDQRGRGQSAAGFHPEDVTLASEMSDLTAIIQHHRLSSSVLLGHSWGAVLALEYALRHPDRVSHLILMNPAPASVADVAAFRTFYAQRVGADLEPQRAIAAGTAYQAGDPEAVTARYRLHFKPSLHRAEDFEKLMSAMKQAFISQGAAGILKARAVEDRVIAQTWGRPDYDLLPKLRALRIPTLVIAGDKDFIPVETAKHIADAIPGSRFVAIPDCGHFSFLECPAPVRTAMAQLFAAQEK